MSTKTAVAAATPDPWDEIVATWELREAAERIDAAIRDYWRARADEEEWDEVQPPEGGMGPSGGGA